ncbi:MAG TPA: response regulator [Verrucomicrobiae bacterium]|nr:response regulator [Verrucomicrobiae bacterium]
MMKPKILTVDDSKTIRLIVAKTFKAFDCDIFEASNGVEGLAIAAREKPNVIILDLTMPVMDGAEMLAKLKANPELKTIPVIMLTAEAGRENVLRIAKLGVRDYLIKPFKETMLIDRVGRVVELRPAGGELAAKRFDDPLQIIVVDDKPAIVEQIRHGLSDTPWNIQSKPTVGQAMEICNILAPDAILVSLALADNAGFSLFQMIKASPRLKNVPIFALSVKTATDEQARAQQCGFAGVVTKPIDCDDLRAKICKALNLDTTYRYFEIKKDVLALKVPADFSAAVATDMSERLRDKITEAVNSGVEKVVIDMSRVTAADANVVKFGLTVAQTCEEFSLKQRMVGTDAISLECKNYEETKDWQFESSFEEALAALNGSSLASAAV